MELRADHPAVSSMRAARQRRPQGGFSLVELMIAMVLGLLLTAGIIEIYASSKQSYNTQEAIARMQENGRFAMDLITQDLRRAGYWGGNADVATFSGVPGPVDPAGTCVANDNSWGRMIEWRVHGLNDDASPYACVQDWLRGDVVTVRYGDFEPSDPALLEDDVLYVRTNLFAGRVITGATANAVDNQIGPLGADEDVVRPLRAHAYYVGPSAASCAATGGQVPGLWRVDLENGEPVAGEVAPGVEHLQLRLLENGDYVDADAVVDWAAVSAVRVWLLMRSECPEGGFVNETEYQMGDLGDDEEPYAPNDGFRRQLYLSTVMLRNTR